MESCTSELDSYEFIHVPTHLHIGGLFHTLYEFLQSFVC